MKTWLLGALLALGTLAVYLPATRFDFTNYDDTHYVTENIPVCNGLTWQGVKWALTSAHSGNWHPLTWLSHMTDCQLYGLNSGGHHFTNIVFHAANAVLLFLLLRSLTGALWPSAAVAGFFALHPLHVESVAWIAERKDVLSAFFGLISLLAYTGYARSGTRPAGACGEKGAAANIRKSATWYSLALGAFASGLMSKPMLVTWPCVMLLLDYWPLRRYLEAGPKSSIPLFCRKLCRETTRFDKVCDEVCDKVSRWVGSIVRLIREKLPFFLLSAAACIVAVLSQKAAAAMAPLDQLPFGSRAANALVCYLKYVEKLLWPSDLAVIYPYMLHWPTTDVLIALLFVVAISVLAIWQRQQRPYLLVGWLWYLGTLVPVIGLVQVGNQSMADRYTYLPSIGILIMMAWGAAEVAGRNRIWRLSIGLATGGALIACAMVTQIQLAYWRNTETLFRHALEVTQNNLVAHNSLGFYYAQQGDWDRAKRSFESALSLNPANPAGHSGLARVLLSQGKSQEAVAEAEQAAHLDPTLAEAQTTLGQALMKQGSVNEALAHYAEAVRLRPDSAIGHYNMANALARLGQLAPAGEQYRRALALDPGLADAHNNLAYLLAREGHLDEAARQFELALKLQPGFWQARYGLGDVLARAGRYEAAVRELSTVVGQRPEFTDGLSRLAWLLATNANSQFRDPPQAVQLAERACKLANQQQPALLRTLAVAYAAAGRFNEAVATAELARDRAQTAGQKELAGKLQELADQFRAGKLFRESELLTKP